jgi:hypothetical protein
MYNRYHLEKGNCFCNFIKTAKSKRSPNGRQYWAKMRPIWSPWLQAVVAKDFVFS